MDGTPHLLTDVKFSERRKGYDPDEVDNFLERVSAAVAQLQDKLRDATSKAEEADARINEAKRAQTVAEAQVDQLKADLHRTQSEAPAAPAAPVATPAVGDDAERASALLVMAQKTADAAIEDAQRTADSTLTEAQSRATTLVGDAQADADRIRSDAQRIADDLVEQKRTAAVAEVAALEELKGQIQFDVDVLQRHVDEERSTLREAISRLGALIDDPSAFRVSEAPAVSNASSAGIIDDEGPAGAGFEAIDEIDDPVDDEPLLVLSDDEDDLEIIEIGAGLSSDDEVDIVEIVEIVEMDPVDDLAATADADEVRADDEPADDESGDDEPGDDVVTITASGATPESSEQVSERLFAAEPDGVDLDSGPPTEAFQPFTPQATADRPEGLGVPNDDEDKAMRAFFETDFDTVEAEKRSRWRR